MKKSPPHPLGVQFALAVALVGGLSLLSAGCATDGQQATRSKTAKSIQAGTATQPSTTPAIEVTGSHLKYRAQRPGEIAAGLHVTVIDPQTALNRGYSSPLEVLVKTPSVYRGR